jgi:monoterpene epsilon-lactone hydrolase
MFMAAANVLFPGESGTSEPIMMAALGHFKVISVDYRMPPEGYFPAALDDAMTVYKAALKTSAPKNWRSSAPPPAARWCSR